MAPAITALIPLLGNVFDRLFPDPAAAADAKVKVMEMAQRGELAQLDADVKLATGQIAVNQAEASSGNWFASSWRPFVGWVCGFAFAFKFIGGPLLVLIAQYYGHTVTLPQFDYAEMSTILLGMLGLGGLRSWDKKNGLTQ